MISVRCLVARTSLEGILNLLAKSKFFWLLPGESLAAKVTKCSCLRVDGLVKLQGFDNDTRAKIEVILNDLFDQGV